MTIDLLQVAQHIAPLFIVILVIAGLVWSINKIVNRRLDSLGKAAQFRRQTTVLIVILIGIAAVILALPIDNSNRNQLLTLYGLVLTAIITLASTTFASNMMAGFMLRSVKSFRPGDFIRVSDHFGRVTEQDLFHTEIQTEDRDLVTLPNLFLAIQPIRVIRSSGTIVSAELSLGYDVPKHQIEQALVAAAQQAELEDPFVQIQELGDFSITYRIAGFLAETRQLISTRSALRRYSIDELHSAGIEIVSPTFMNQRQFRPEQRFIPEPTTLDTDSIYQDGLEAIMFDKAEMAEKIERVRDLKNQSHQELKELETSLADAGKDTELKEELKQKIEQQKAKTRRLSRVVKALEERRTED